MSNELTVTKPDQLDYCADAFMIVVQNHPTMTGGIVDRERLWAALVEVHATIQPDGSPGWTELVLLAIGIYIQQEVRVQPGSLIWRAMAAAITAYFKWQDLYEPELNDLWEEQPDTRKEQKPVIYDPSEDNSGTPVIDGTIH